MNFFNRKTSWTNAEFIPLKLCIASAYVIIGTYFHFFFRTLLHSVIRAVWNYRNLVCDTMVTENETGKPIG